MQLRQHVRDSLEWVCMNPLTCCRTWSRRLSKIFSVSKYRSHLSTDYSQPLYCKICHIQCNSDSFVALVSLSLSTSFHMPYGKSCHQFGIWDRFQQSRNQTSHEIYQKYSRSACSYQRINLCATS